MSSPRPRVLAAGLTFGLLVAGCAGTDTTPVGPSDTAALASPKPGVAVMRGGNVQSVLGLYTIRVEAGAAGASVEPLALRTGAANDDLYLLPIDRFLKPTSLAVTAVSWTPTTVDLAWAFTHPFPAPIDPAAAPNGSTNRADLGIAGALVILQDVESAVGNTFFSDRIANTSLVVNPDAYLSPETMVASTTVANTFPYQTLVDETGEGSRVFTSNGGDPMGNFGSDGWTRDELGGTYDQWSGYGVLHQGQISRRTLSLNRAALAAGEVLTFDVAVLAKYNDPRGGSTSRERRANRLPPATPDHTRFAYRMPHGALDVERVRFLGESGGFIANQPTTSTLAFRVDDWDARATESTFSDLADEPEVTAVAPGEAGLPDLAVSLPGVLGDHTTVVDWDPAADLVDDDSAYGGDAEPDSGRPGDGLVYVRTLAKPAGAGETGGMYVGLVRATDPEVPNITDPAFILELDGMLVPLSGVVPQPITYQAFTVTVGNPNHPPSAIATVTTPTVITGSGVGLSVSNLADPDNGSVTVSVDWDANGTTDYTSGAIPVPGGPVAYNSQTHGGMTFTFVPPGPDYRTLKVFVSDGAATVEITPGLGPNNEHFQVIANQAGWVRTWGAAVNDTRCWGVAVDGAGNTYAVGFFSSGANMGGGPRTTNGNLDIFVAKFDPAGTYLWDRTFGSTGQDEARAVACDNAGNVVITGIYTGTINFGGGGRPAVTGFDAFAVKLDPSGVYGWDKTWATVGDDLAWGAGMNAAGTEVAITGKHAGGLDFGGGFRSGNRRFVVRHNMATGAYVWDAPWTVTQGINVYGDCEYDASGNLYVMGHYESGNDFGSGPQGTFGSDDVFLCKFTAPGTFAWVQVFGGPSTEVGQALAIDSAGNPIVAHKSFGTMTYLSGMATGANQGVVKFNPAGTRLWDYFFLSGGSNWGLAVDGADNIAFTGGFTGSVNFGGGLRSAGGGFGSMLVKLSSGGVYIWDAIFAAGSGVNYSFGLDSAPDGSYRVAGNFTGTKDFDPSPATFNVTAAGSGSSAHLCRINGNGLW